MSNTMLTIDMITMECLRLAHEKASFLGTINRQFDDSFGKAEGKIGDTLRIRLPSQYQRRDRKSTRLNSSHIQKSRMPSSA